MKLYNYWRSSASWRVRIALAYKNVAYEYVAVNITPAVKAQNRAEYQKLNPMQQVPTLVLDDGRQLAQSMAILEYLEETLPRPSLLPSDPYLRARARQLAELVNAGIQPFQNLPTMASVKELGGDPKEFVRGYIARGLDALAASAEATAGNFLVADAPSFADVCLVPQLNAARRFDLDPARWPLLARVDEACMRLQPFQAAHADRQPDAVVEGAK
ncbi:MAG: maleylacetoacetate isomerase [Myxococcales bacterium]|nr:maleylacetoacetate isomerase [Myxococcales bacterium]